MSERGQWDVPWIRRRLPCGATLWMLPQRHFRLCHISASFAVGSRHERVNGTAHMLEHLIFRGTKRMPTMHALSSAFELLAGDFNAQTTRHSTTYEVDCLPSVMPQVVALLAEVLLAPRLVGIRAERQIVLEEILADFDDDGQLIHADELAWGSLFAGPLGLPIAGTPGTLDAITSDAVAAFYRAHYCADNLTIVATGRFSADRLYEALATTFAFPAGKRAIDVPAGLRAPLRELQVLRHDLGTQVDFTMLAMVGELDEREMATLELLVRLLDDGLSSRMRKVLVSERALVYDLECSLSETSEGTQFSLRLSCRKARVQRVVEALVEVLLLTVDMPPTDEEWLKLRRRITVDLAALFDAPTMMGSWIHYCHRFSHDADLNARHQRFLSVEPVELSSMLRRVLASPQRWVIVGDVTRHKAQRLHASLCERMGEEYGLSWRATERS